MTERLIPMKLKQLLRQWFEQFNLRCLRARFLCFTENGVFQRASTAGLNMFSQLPQQLAELEAKKHFEDLFLCVPSFYFAPLRCVLFFFVFFVPLWWFFSFKFCKLYNTQVVN